MEFKARITPAECRAKIEEDKAKAAAKLGEKEVAPKKPKREKPENSGNTGEEAESKTEEKKAPKPKKQKEPTPLEFPVRARINNYGFLNLRKGLLAALDWHKGMALKIDKNPDGSVTVRKA